MPTNIGRFEILSELSKSSTGIVYKANDPQSGQTIALKAVQLSAFGESAAALEAALLEEFEKVKALSSPNLLTISSADVIDGQFCAAMEYVQGNSIATMLARKEGFSIWDLLDIGRQLTGGLDHAASHQIVHYSLEPSKIMCGWDGTVKIMSFGVSSVGNFVQHVAGAPSSILHYMSPEQLRGEAMDGRSNLFSLGAMLYEMVTERKAFDREDAESLRESILESTPVAPIHVNVKVHPLLSDLIMKALAKDPAQRYQNGRELLNDLEKCKETKPAKKAEAPKGTTVSDKAKTAAVQAKFVGTSAPPAAAPVSSPAAPAKAVDPHSHAQRASAAAAGVGANTASSHSPAPELLSAGPDAPSASMSSAVADEPPVETFEPQTAPAAPHFAVDPLMAEGTSSAGASTSFSEISELPPLKEAYVAPPPPPEPPVETSPAPSGAAVTASARSRQKVAEKPRIQPREVAGKAIKEIKGVPPKLMMYSIAGAVALILLIGLGVMLYIHSLNSDADPGASRAAAASAAPAQPVQQQPAPQPEAAAPAAADTTAPAQDQPTEISEPEVSTPQPAAHARTRAGSKKKAVAAAVIPGQLTIDSVPQGAQIQLDGATDPSWVTPVVLSNIQPGSHSITLSKSGFAPDSRSVEVASGAHASAVIHLSQLSAMLVVKSEPAGASIYIDGHDAGAKTPAQINVGKGQHVVLVRMSGYLDETMNAQFVLGQTFNFSPTLRALGNADSIHTVGKMSKLFGKGGQAGQATVVIHTQPKGAEVAVNKHMLEKNSPVDVMLDPGTYEIDITLTGYTPIHKVITAEKGNKMVIDEVLQPQ